MFEIDKDNLPFVRTRQALLVLDLQNEFISPEGQLPVGQPPHFVENILRLLPDFRASGNIIWIRSVFEASRPVNGNGEDSEEVVTDSEVAFDLDQGESMLDSRRRIVEAVEERNGKHGFLNPRVSELANMVMEADESDEASAEETFLTVPPGEEPRFVLPQSLTANPPLEVLDSYDAERDILVQKSYYSAFKDGSLIKMLRSRFVTEIYICGALSNMSVYATAVDAAQFGLAITLVDDCLGYRSKERHEEALRRLLQSTGCDNITSIDLSADLKKKAAIVQKQTAPAPRPMRRQQSKQRSERKVKEPELDSMMSKLNLTPDGSSIPTGNPPSSHSPNTPAPPMNSVPSLVADIESGGSFESIESESHELQLPMLPPRRSPEVSSKPDRVQTKIRTRKRPPKQSPTASTSTSTESVPPSGEKVPETTKSPTTSLKTDDMPKKTVKASTSGMTQSLESKIPTKETKTLKTNGTRKIEPSIEDSLNLLSLKHDPSSAGMENSVQVAEEAPRLICEGDTTIIPNLLKGELAEGIFEKIRDEVRWQRMSHQGGEVPRLVAVQGKMGSDGSIPIYRHPADESPPLLPFSPTVSLIREEAEKKLGHPLNHVLIQFYRDGTDYISEHSDKTLDIVPKTFIVNVSLGAQRTMIFRTKKKQNTDGTKSTVAAPRESTRAPMPHNSMCKVGLVTNMRWLHGIRQDKRLPSEKSDAELAYGTARISLTFRQIGTFLSSDQQRIWGQGAVSKTKDKANFVINGDTPEAEQMIRAFGQENHSSDFDWAGHYGAGFDVLHLNNTPKLFLSGNLIADSRVRLALAEYGIKWDEGKLSSSFKWQDGVLKADSPEIPSNLPVKFVDNDLSKSSITGDMAILLYLNAVYGSSGRSQLETAGLFTRLQQVAELQALLDTPRVDSKSRAVALELWDGFAKENEFMVGKELSIVDWMLLPVLENICNEHGLGGLNALEAYYSKVRASNNAVVALGAVKPRVMESVDGEKEDSAQAKKAKGELEIIEADDNEDDEDDDEDDE